MEEKSTMKSKMTAGLLAFFVGGLGVHKFYLGENGIGVVYLLFCWTGIPAIIAFIEAIILLTMSDEDFNAKYNGVDNTQKVVPSVYTPVETSNAVNQQPTAVNAQSAQSKVAQSPQVDVAQTLMTYKNLLDTGVITQEEFDTIKHKLLKRGV